MLNLAINEQHLYRNPKPQALSCLKVKLASFQALHLVRSTVECRVSFQSSLMGLTVAHILPRKSSVLSQSIDLIPNLTGIFSFPLFSGIFLFSEKINTLEENEGKDELFLFPRSFFLTTSLATNPARRSHEKFKENGRKCMVHGTMTEIFSHLQLLFPFHILFLIQHVKETHSCFHLCSKK